MLKSLLLGAVILFSPAIASAGEWVLVDPPTYVKKNCRTCINTYNKGQVYWYTVDIPCVLQKGSYTVLNGTDLLIHNIAIPKISFLNISSSLTEK